MGRSSRLLPSPGRHQHVGEESRWRDGRDFKKQWPRVRHAIEPGARWHADQDEVATLSYNCLTNSVGLASIGPKSNMHPPRFPLRLSSGSGNTGRRPVPGAPCEEQDRREQDRTCYALQMLAPIAGHRVRQYHGENNNQAGSATVVRRSLQRRR